MSANTMLVRLKPFAPRQGFVLRRYMAFGLRFDADRGWYEVPANVAQALRTIREQEDVPNSPLAFDVCTRAEAEAMEIAEQKAKAEAVAAASAPHVTSLVGASSGALSTTDLKQMSEPAAPTPPATMEPALAVPSPAPAPTQPRSASFSRRVVRRGTGGGAG